MEKSDSIIIIPTYNEKENIENIIRAVFGLEKFFHILIIEDNSPDGTATIVRKLQTEFPDRLFMIERKGKLGLGTAYIAGFKWAIEHQYDFVFEMDIFVSLFIIIFKIVYSLLFFPFLSFPSFFFYVNQRRKREERCER